MLYRIRFVLLFSLFLVFDIGSAFISRKRHRYQHPKVAVFRDRSGDTDRIGNNAYIEFQHFPTNVTVTLVGCLHGSVSSAKDVYGVLCQQSTDAVVLELCPMRYGTIQKRLLKKKEAGTVSRYDEITRSRGKERTFGLSASLLGGVSVLQASLSGFQPGLEFITAIEYVNTMNIERTRCYLILADQAVDVTLERMDALPKVSYDMIENFCVTGFRWDQSYYSVQSKALLEAIWGRLDLGRVLTRTYHAFIDLLKLTLPPVILLQTMLFFASTLLGTVIREDQSDIPMTADSIDMVAERLVQGSLSAAIVYLSYIFIVLPLVQIVIHERDDQLASGIAAACALLRQQQDYNEDNYTPRVVAVLGLLHVNGVAKRLIDSSH
jgi:pheromone shutdown protein TraB